MTGQTADKWQLLSDLTKGAECFGLGHRTLGVLKALLTFLPGQQIAADRPVIVFPSNRTLSERLNGMPESTLRRHIARLVTAGLLARCDSPNRKRFARRAGTQGIAFGFDLSPLARLANQLLDAARHAQDRADHHALLRARLLSLCHAHPDHPTHAEARKALRRKGNTRELEALIATFPEDDTHQMSGTDSQNERHIQETERKDSVHKTDLNLAQVKAACPAVETYYPGAVTSWDAAQRISREIGPMMGIERSVMQDAERRLGAIGAATTIFSMLEKVSTLRSPGAYLRKLCQLAEFGQYDPKSALKSSIVS